MPLSPKTSTKKTPRSSSSSRATAQAKRAAVADVAPLPVVESATPPIDDAIGYELDKPINLPQLQSEINALSSVDVVNTALSGPDDQSQPISDSNELVLWIAPPGVDAGAVAQAFANHVPDPHWGIPQFNLDFNALLERLREDPQADLTSDEESTLIRGVAINFAMMTGPPSGA